MQPLRDELEAVVAEEGWSKAGLQKMQKLDSFIKECNRLHPFMSRMLILKPFAVSGVTLGIAY